MIRFKSFPDALQLALFLTLLAITTFGLACKGTPSSSILGEKPFEGEITSKMYIGDSPSALRSAIKGSRTRTETEITLPQMSFGGSKQSVTHKSVTIMDLSTMTVTTLDPQEKTYTTMNFGKNDSEMAKEVPSMAVPKVTSTGQTETIAGYTCKHWLINDELDYCMAQGLGNFGGGTSGGILDSLKRLSNTKSQVNPEYVKFVEGGAYPLKIANIKNGQSKTIMEVTSIERKSLDDSLFTAPADYKKTELPQIPGMSPIER